MTPNKRLASLKKKPLTPTKEIQQTSKYVYLYYADNCEFCKELIRILFSIPDLTKMIKCINVNEYEISKEIDSIPTLDEGTTDGKVLHKLENAFKWVVHQCFNLLDLGRITHLDVVKVEERVKKVFRRLEIEPHVEVRDYDIMRKGTGDNPHDKYKTYSESSENFSSLTRSDEHREKPRVKGSVKDRMKSWERDRQEMMSTFKKKWEKEGIIEEPKTIKRENLKSTKGISETQIKEWETERMRMLDHVASRHGGGIQEPIKRQSIKMGTTISDKDMQNYEQERQKMMERIRS